MSQGQRRLAAIMFTDMVGYTSLGQRNEALSLALLDEQRKLVRAIFSRHHGREVKTMGDAFLAEFPNALDAVRCAYDIQRATRELNISLPEERRIHLRIGVHLGDVVESDGDISGDAVNVASRIEPLADDGGVCITGEVYSQVRNKVELRMSNMGAGGLKNVELPVEVYKVEMPWEGQSGTAQGLDARRIAILPFVSLSPDPNDEYFADGLTEELIDRLCQVRELAVIASTSTMNYKGAKKSASQIGRELKAGALVEGSVRKSLNKIRVTAKLIKSETEEHLWSSKYDRDLADIFQVQSDIAERVVEALKVKLLPAERMAVQKRPTESMEAFILYLKGRYYWSERTETGLKRAAECFQRAIDLDPAFARAYSGLADTFSIMGFYHYISPQDSAAKSEAFASRALEIDDHLAEAYSSLAYVEMNRFAWQEAERLQRKAIELNPSYATAHFWYGIILQWQWRFDEAVEQAKQAEKLDPLSPAISIALGQTLVYARRYDEAIEHLEERIRADPELSAPHFLSGIAYYCKGMYEKSVQEEQKALSVWGRVSDRPMIVIGWSLARLGRVSEAKDILRKLKERNAAKHLVGTLHLELGEKEEALTCVEEAFQAMESGLGWISVMPVYFSLRSEARFEAVLRKMNLPLGPEPEPRSPR